MNPLRRIHNSAPYLQSIVDIGAGICCARIRHLSQVFVRCDLEADTDWRSGCGGPIRVTIDGNGVIQRFVTGDGRVVVDVIRNRCASCPKNDRLRVWVSRSYTMGEVELRCTVGRSTGISFVDLVDGHPQTGVIPRGTSVIEIACIGSSGSACKGQRGQQVKHCN